MKLKVFNRTIWIMLAAKGTIWFWNTPKTKFSPTQRIDSLLAVERVFLREYRVYIYTFKVGRLQVLIF